MTINTRRFGQVEIEDDDIVFFPEGLVGLSSFKRFVMLRDPESANLIWLQSVDQEEFALATMHSSVLDTEYRIELRADEVGSIELESSDDAEVFLVINRIEGTYSANLKGPVIINARKMLGKQVVLRDSRYGIRHALVSQDDVDQNAGPGAGTAQAAKISISTRS